MPLLLWSRNVSKCRFTLSVWMCFKVLERHHEVTDAETTSGLKANLSIKSLFFFFFKSLKPIKSGGQRLFCLKIDGDDDNRVLMVMTLKHQSACDLCGLCHQFGAVPNGLELLGHWKLPLLNNQKTSALKQELQHWIKTNPDARRESRQHSQPLCPLSRNTYKIIISLRYQDVHLRACGTDDVAVEGVLAQVDLAALCLVDGDGGNFSQYLKRDLLQLLTGMCGTICTLRGQSISRSKTHIFPFCRVLEASDVEKLSISL